MNLLNLPTYIYCVPTGQGKLEKVWEFEWSGKVGGNIFLEKLRKSQGK